jgi:phosphatidylserine/phosphatidylglycerophosphate/cardiolipin synthase-like enzyme
MHACAFSFVDRSRVNFETHLCGALRQRLGRCAKEEDEGLADDPLPRVLDHTRLRKASREDLKIVDNSSVGVWGILCASTFLRSLRRGSRGRAVMRGARWLLAAAAVSLVACGSAESEEDEEGFSLDAVTGERPFRPDIADTSTWTWHSRSEASCTPSPQAATVLEAAKRAKKSDDIIPKDLYLTTRNAAGPAFLESSEMFPALAGVIANAEHEVDLQWHIIDSDSDGFHDVIGGIKKLHERLAADKAAGKERTHPVVIRLVSPDWALKPGNSVQKQASAIRQHVGEIDPTLIKLEVAAHRYFSLAVMHVKMAIIDGAIVHVGGGNLSNHQNYHDGAAHERDSAYVVKGAIGKAALAQFDDMWNHRATTAYACNAERCAKINDRPKLKVKIGSQAGSGHLPEVADPDLSKFGLAEDACLPMVFMAKRASEFVPSWEIDHPVGQGLRAAFGASTSVLKISTPNLNDRFVGPLIDAARSKEGKVQILLPQTFNEFTEAIPYLGGGTNRMIAWWLVKRVGKENVGRDQLLDLKWFSVDGRTPQRGGWATGGRHVKYYSVDGQLALIGSTNLDKQSMSRSREVTIGVDDATVTKQWDAKIFDADFNKGIGILKENEQAVPTELPDEDMDKAPQDVQEDWMDGL